MHDTLTTPLPASWLSSRLGVNAKEIEKLRSRGELFAVRDRDEWLYPAWQFGPGGSIPAGVREAVKAARAAGLDESRLVALLRDPPGCSARPACSTCSSKAARTSCSRRSGARPQCEHDAGPAYAGPVRILLVSQMYPGPDAPDLGTFVAQVERELAARGHEIERAVLDTRAGGKLRYLTLARKTLEASRPDVVYAHFLVPAGLIAAVAGRAPLVVTAHGRDVRNIGAFPGIGAATRLVVRRASTVVCVSRYLQRELETKLPDACGKTEVVSSGVDRERFAVTEPPPGPPGFLCVGALDERKNVVRLADAFAELGEGTLTFAGDGPSGRSSRDASGSACSDVSRTPRSAPPRRVRVLAQPSLVEPLGQALLEAMAAAGRSWRRGSAGRRSSCRRKPASSSTRST